MHGLHVNVQDVDARLTEMERLLTARIERVLHILHLQNELHSLERQLKSVEEIEENSLPGKISRTINLWRGRDSKRKDDDTSEY